MAMLEWVSWLPPPRALAALVLATAGFLSRLAACYLTRSATLEVDTWYAFSRLLGLFTTVIAFKMPQSSGEKTKSASTRIQSVRPDSIAQVELKMKNGKMKGSALPSARDVTAADALKSLDSLHLALPVPPAPGPQCSPDASVATEKHAHEAKGRLRNTYGWARVELVGRLAVHVLFTSFAFSLVMSVLQSAIHTHSEDKNKSTCDRYPGLTIGVAVGGLIIHLIGYLLLAGQRLGYGRAGASEGGRPVSKPSGRLGVLGHAVTDILSCVFVVLAALATIFAKTCKHADDMHESRLWRKTMIDPAISVISSVVLVACSYPVLREAGMVLLETVPADLATQALLSEAEKVPGVLAVHELHVWQLYPKHVIATAHVFYRTQVDYLRSLGLVSAVFGSHGITHVTLQPEFATDKDMPPWSERDGESQQKSVCLRQVRSRGRPCVTSCVAPGCCIPPTTPPP